MKKLYIMRHAKSDWNDSSVTDFDRPLNERGKKDAPEMGKRLKKKGIKPELIVSSPAIRAIKTAREIAKNIGYPEKEIELNPQLYGASINDILNVIHNFDNKYEKIMLFGHNPGFTGIVGYLTDHFIDNLPTTGVVQINFEMSSWYQILEGNGKLVYFDFPKNQPV